MKKTGILVAMLMIGMMFSGLSRAADPEIVKAVAEKSNAGWTFHVTLKHPDTGWSHYADGWRVVSEDGKELGMRVLYHPHEQEQPFTRSLTQVKIPASLSYVYVEARCKKTGWGKQRYKVNLR
jgi:hypothetical protein